jgi:hypothetical protein
MIMMNANFRKLFGYVRDILDKVQIMVLQHFPYNSTTEHYFVLCC